MKEIFDLYSVATRMAINLDKSALYSFRLEGTLADIIGMIFKF
jgi:hypothetical protein